MRFICRLHPTGENDILNLKEIPVITLWQPWASWIAAGWKTIETRFHPRFACLVGKTIGIHAGQYWDPDWLEKAGPWLNSWEGEIDRMPEFNATRSCIVCTAVVTGHRVLGADDSVKALIDCDTVKRWGLELSNISPLIQPISCKGKQGIWYYKATQTKT